MRDLALRTADEISRAFAASTDRPHRDGLDPEPPWRSEVRTGPNGPLRTDLEVVDRTDDRGVLTLHACAHPRHGDPSPIYGFDVVLGGGAAVAFLDLSPTDPAHPSVARFADAAAPLNGANRRADLPEWATAIFSPGILAVRGLDGDGLRRVCALATATLRLWTDGLSPHGPARDDVVGAHRRYSRNQRMNVRTRRSLVALGYDAAYVDRFIATRLFPDPESMAAG